MNPCKQCGADLPDQARYCFQCGTAVDAPRKAAGSTTPPMDFLQPALAGGMALGLLSSIPFISAGNCLCCMWVLGGGALAVLMISKQHPNLTYGDGAFAGVLSGLFGAVVATVVSVPMRILSARFFESQQQAMEEALREAGAEGALRDLMLSMVSPEITAVGIVTTFFMNLMVFALFAMIGGILMVGILNKRSGSGPSVP